MGIKSPNVPFHCGIKNILINSPTSWPHTVPPFIPEAVIRLFSKFLLPYFCCIHLGPLAVSGVSAGAGSITVHTLIRFLRLEAWFMWRSRLCFFWHTRILGFQWKILIHDTPFDLLLTINIIVFFFFGDFDLLCFILYLYLTFNSHLTES